MKVKTIFFALLTMLFAALPQCASNSLEIRFQIYVGTYDKSKETQIIITLPENRLTPAMGISLAEEIQKTFHVDELELISAPKIMTQIGHNATIEQGCQLSPGKAIEQIKLSITPISMEGNVAHIQCAFSILGKDQPGAEFFARLGEPVTLASRMDGKIYFIVCTFQLPNQESLGESVIIVPTPMGDIKVDYPTQLKEKKIAGKIRLQFDLNDEGRPGNFRVVQSDHSDLAAPAIDAVKKCSWDPGKKGSIREMMITIIFKLSD